MLIEFEGENTGRITMFGDVATQLLKLMGQSGQPEGALREEDVPAALQQLKSALANMQEPEVEDDEEAEEPVSLHTRAQPLMELLESSMEKGGYFMWKEQ